MHLKRFKGREVPEVMRQVRDELGPEAVILHTRPSRPRGAFGFLHPPEIEILAAVDHVEAPAGGGAIRSSGLGPGAVPRPQDQGHGPQTPESGGRSRASDSVESLTRGEPRVKFEPSGGRDSVGSAPAGESRVKSEASHRFREGSKPVQLSAAPHRAPAPPPLRDLGTEVRELRDLVIRLGGGRFLPPVTVPVYERLVAAGTDPVLAFEIVAGLDRLPDRPDESIYRALEQRVTSMLPVTPPTPTSGTGVIAVVGPSGTGKTTTLAKLAARATIERGPTWILSVDGESLGARGQLETLSAILGCPYELTLTAGEVARAVAAGPSERLTLIDTPGISPHDRTGLERLRDLLRAARPKAVHLVLSATCKPADALPAIRAFSPLGATHLLFTRLDETTSHGSLLTVGVESGLPLSYFATGREIPDDLHPAMVPELLRRIVHGDSQR